jgi:hypothetical protein
MEGETGLSGMEDVGQITDALLAFKDAVDDPQACLIRQGMEPARSPFEVFSFGGWHGSIYINES